MMRRSMKWGGCMALVTAAMLVAPHALALPRSALPQGLDGARKAAKEGRPGEPGSGKAAPGRRRSGVRSKLRAPLPRRPQDEAEAKGIAQMEQMAARFRDAHEATSHTVSQMLVVGAAQGRRALQAQYGREIRTHQAKARKLRAQAIRRYNDFLRIHPDDATWTPEIMYRLAELHFESSAERLARQEEAYEKELAAYTARLEEDPDAVAPAGPTADYTESIALFRSTVLQFPRYRFNDAALYMMGTLLYEHEEFDNARAAYLALTCANRFEPPMEDGTNVTSAADFKAGDYGECTPRKKDSPYVPEAWLRTGEIHYDLDELDPALEAYAQAASDPEGDLYDEALIRMAWAQYLKRDFAEAAKTFDVFIRYADEHRDDSKAAGAVSLRDDAVRYLAKAYVEEDWNGDGRRDRLVGFRRLDRDYSARGKERHVPEVYAALGDLLAFQTDFAEAIRIWKATLTRWPLAPAAPSIQHRIMQAYAMLQDEPGSKRARDLLATNYLRGTKWFYANEDDPDTIEAALKLAEDALVATALDHHLTAQALRSGGEPAKAKLEYAIAAKAYEAYLERFPDTESSYEYRFNFADALYYSDDFAKSAQQYAQVRDSNLDNRLQEDAASGAVLALEALVDQEQAAGRLALPDMPKEGMPGPFDQPQTIPGLMLRLQAAYDRFIAVRPDSEQTGSMKYLAGAVSQRYLHFDDAEARFTKVLDDHCADNVSINAGKAIIDGKVVRKDLKAAQEWTEKLMAKACGSGDESKKFAGELKAIGNAVRFQEATILYEAGEFEAAADRYVALVNQAPDDPAADKALNNAAVAYEEIGRFSSASQTYERIYKNYPDSEFADDALLRTGYNHSRFFEFDAAVKSYLILATDKRYADSEHREKALKNAAALMDSLQNYKRSAQLFGDYAAQAESPTDKAEARFRAAKVLGKTDDHRATIRAYEQYLGMHGAQPSEAERAVEAKLRIGKAYAKMGKRRQAESYYRQTVGDFASRALKNSTDAADLPAEAQFLLAEYALADVLQIKLKSTGRKLEKEAKQLVDSVLAAANAYESVFPYRRLDWVLAGMYRKGYALETTAIKMREAPVPKKLRPETEAWYAYKDMIEVAAAQAEGMAVKLYEATVKRSREFALANDWSRAATERLNIYKPVEYPLLREPAVELQVEDLR